MKRLPDGTIPVPGDLFFGLGGGCVGFCLGYLTLILEYNSHPLFNHNSHHDGFFTFLLVALPIIGCMLGAIIVHAGIKAWEICAFWGVMAFVYSLLATLRITSQGDLVPGSFIAYMGGVPLNFGFAVGAGLTYLVKTKLLTPRANKA